MQRHDETRGREWIRADVGWCSMVYSNFDTRVKAKCRIPADRLRYLRQLEQKVQQERIARKAGAATK